MVKTHGANVSPDEVEEVIRNTCNVVEAAVFGVPDETLGAMVVAVIVRAPGSDMTEASLQAALKAELSSFKVPRRVFFYGFDELPRTPSNKVRKPALAEIIAARLKAEAKVEA